MCRTFLTLILQYSFASVASRVFVALHSCSIHPIVEVLGKLLGLLRRSVPVTAFRVLSCAPGVRAPWRHRGNFGRLTLDPLPARAFSRHSWTERVPVSP